MKKKDDGDGTKNGIENKKCHKSYSQERMLV